MRRALCLLIALAAVIALGVSPAATQVGQPPVDGLYMVDYSKPPNFKVGSWVRYRATTRSLSGTFQEYWLTLIIAGEEDFWGDRGFWLETITEDPGQPPQSVACLISYDAFGDTAAIRHPIWFQRKLVQGIDQDANPVETIALRPGGELRTRAREAAAAVPDPDRPPAVYDTLGADTTMIPLGTYRGPLCRMTQSWYQTRNDADSTVYVYRHESRVQRKSREIPITCMAREDLDDVTGARHWKSGMSQDARERLVERVTGSTTLVAFGYDNHPPLSATPARVRGKQVPPDPPRARDTRGARPLPKGSVR